MKEIHVGADEEELSSIIRGLQHQISVLRQQCDEDIQDLNIHEVGALREKNRLLEASYGNKCAEVERLRIELGDVRARADCEKHTLIMRCGDAGVEVGRLRAEVQMYKKACV